MPAGASRASFNRRVADITEDRADEPAIDPADGFPADAALLTHRHPHPKGHPARRAGGIRGQDCLRSGETIGAGVWPGIWRQEPAPDDPICRGVPGAGDCRITDTTIELDPLHRADPAEQATTARLLRGDVQERPRSGCNWLTKDSDVSFLREAVLGSSSAVS
jgi:hypothetical protein